MLSIVRALRALPVACLVLLASCGGSVDPVSPPMANPIKVSEPPPAPLDTVLYVATARTADCADTRNRLYVIDNKMVFWDKAGNCADASYSRILYAPSRIEPLCSIAETIAGPMTRCNDEAARPMFETILRNLDLKDLGLGPTHTVLEIDVLPKDGSSYTFGALEAWPQSGVKEAKNLVIRDAAKLAEVWTAHTSNVFPAPDLPKVDFEKQMVLALFGGTRSRCHEFGVQRIAVIGERLVAYYNDRDVTPVALCAAVINAPMQMVVVKKTAASVDFVQWTLELVPYSFLSRSSYSNMTQKAELVIKDGAAFDAMWARHVNGQPDKPAVDFDRQMVIAVFGGGYSNGCHSMSIESINRFDGKINVSVVHWQPAPESSVICTMAIVFPAEMVVLDKTAEEVMFTSQTRYFR